MPTATLSFQLPEEDVEHRHAINALAYLCVINEYDQYLRNLVKYGPEDNVSTFNPQMARDRLHEIIESKGVGEDIQL
jgi:hypothetical protein